MFHEKFNQPHIIGNDGSVSPYEFDCLGSKFNADLSKVDFDFENYEFSHLDEELGRESSCGWLGYRKFWTRSPLSCFSFIGWSAGGDWEHPVNFLIYLDKDGKTFRAYVPKEGNVWNYDTKQAFGNDEDADNAFLKKWFKKNRPELIKKEAWEKTIADNFYGVEDAGVMFDAQKMAHEIMFRFEAV